MYDLLSDPITTDDEKERAREFQEEQKEQEPSPPNRSSAVEINVSDASPEIKPIKKDGE